MVENIRTLGWIALVRAAIGIALGGFLLDQSRSVAAFRAAEPWDAAGFRIVGGLLLFLSALRLVQGVAALRLVSWGRRFGIVIGGIDLLNLIAFPVSTVLGLYALVVYSRPETVVYFASHRSGDEGGTP